MEKVLGYSAWLALLILTNIILWTLVIIYVGYWVGRFIKYLENEKQEKEWRQWLKTPEGQEYTKKKEEALAKGIEQFRRIFGYLPKP